MKRLEPAALTRWQSLPAVEVLLALADFAKEDSTFRPIQSRSTTRWHARVAHDEFELLLTGPKFWDTRAQVGGGGAVDLAMHLMRKDFKSAARELQERGL